MKNKVKYAHKISAIKEQIEEKVRQYINLDEEKDVHAEVECVFVIFKTQEGANRLKDALNYATWSNACTRKMHSLCSTNKTKVDKTFHNDYHLRSKPGISPSLI